MLKSPALLATAALGVMLAIGAATPSMAASTQSSTGDASLIYVRGGGGGGGGGHGGGGGGGHGGGFGGGHGGFGGHFGGHGFYGRGGYGRGWGFDDYCDYPYNRAYPYSCW